MKGYIIFAQFIYRKHYIYVKDPVLSLCSIYKTTFIFILNDNKGYKSSRLQSLTYFNIPVSISFKYLQN